MNGTKVVFDTNALINFFNGNSALQHHAHSTVSLSIVTVLEFLSYPKITPADEELLFAFLKKVYLVDLKIGNDALIHQIIFVRKTYKLKLPDSIIAATALLRNSTLITNDSGFNKITALKISNY